jgi:putative mRNA 3-end processing factor
MALDLSWIRPEPKGLYLPPADAWIDPAHAVAQALVTHGHSDHARGGHGQTIATGATLAIMGLRYGVMPEGARVVDYGQSVNLAGGIRATFVPAGHVLGSAQILLERDGQRVVVTGDYKRRPDPTCAPFQPVRCDVFITEATFGLPVFRHPPIAEEIARLLATLAAHPERCVLVGAYALGKAQRLIAELRRAGHHAPIFLHGAMERMCASIANGASIWASCARRPAWPRARLPGISWSARRPRSTTAGAGACPIRSPPWPLAGCGCASAPGNAMSNCRW